jgi:hypothetical protein
MPDHAQATPGGHGETRSCDSNEPFASVITRSYVRSPQPGLDHVPASDEPAAGRRAEDGSATALLGGEDAGALEAWRGAGSWGPAQAERTIASEDARQRIEGRTVRARSHGALVGARGSRYAPLLLSP